MSHKFVAHGVLGFAVSSALAFSSLAGCAGNKGDDPSNANVAELSSADTLATDTSSTAPQAAHGVSDPGVRGGPPGAGGVIAGVSANEQALWNEGRFRTTEVEATCDDCSDVPQGNPIPPGSDPQTTNSAGLGARYNNVTCTSGGPFGCHSQPTIGGTSPFVNPSFAAATAKGATNVVPFFEQIDGPTREVRFLFNPDGTRDGGVHQKFSVRGRSDAPNCTLGQPDFNAQQGNMAFRIPTPMFGLGIIDSIPDVEILAHKNADLDRKASLGIGGHTNNNGNTGTISRFGWKAQNVSITMFSGEAYNVEMGVTNELFPQSKVEDYNCNLGAEPNDVTRTGPHGGEDAFDDPLKIMADWMVFQIFMRFTDQPQPVPFSQSAQRGLDSFNSIGCAECHVPSMSTRADTTGPQSPALRGVTANLYSDLLVHHMGSKLAENVIQGSAGPDEFRTSPLWGIGQRIFFMSNGNYNNIVDAIMAHYSPASAAHGNTPAYPASEANQVIRNFAALPAGRQQDVVNFLRSL